MGSIDPNGEEKSLLSMLEQRQVGPEEIPSVYELIHTSPVSHLDVHNITEAET